MKNLLLIGAIFITAFAGAAYTAYVLSVTWDWFVFPAFGITSPSVVNLMGLVSMISLIRFDYHKHFGSKAKENNTITPKLLGDTFSARFMIPTVSLGVCYLYTLFM